jgi:hypothetical protein
MTSRKATTDNSSHHMKDPSLHGLLVALGMTSTIAIVVIVFAYAASHGTLFQGITEFLPTLQGLEKLIQESYDEFNVYAGVLLQWLVKAFDFISSFF